MPTNAMHILAEMGTGEWIALLGVVVGVVGTAWGWTQRQAVANVESNAEAKLSRVQAEAESKLLRAELKNVAEKLCRFADRVDKAIADHEERLRAMEVERAA